VTQFWLDDQRFASDMLAPSPCPRFLIQTGDCRALLKIYPDKSVNCCVTSPPYFGLRDYGIPEQIGLEKTPDEFVTELVDVFREVRRVLRDDGTLWLNLGDSYAASGRGGNPKDSAHQKQASNRGSRSFFHNSVVEEGVIGRKWIKPPPGYKQKDLLGIPWMVAFALRADGWYLRQDIIWAKPNPMPESVTDRCTKAHEYIFLLSKSQRYYYDADAIAEGLATDPKENYPARAKVLGRGEQSAANARGNDRDKSGGFPPRNRGTTPRHAAHPNTCDQSGLDEVGRGGRRNKRSVWTVAPKPFKEAHFATFPPALIEPCILAGCPIDGIVLDPFAGAGTTGLVAMQHGRRALLIELNPAYAAMADKRIQEVL
jgi:DNA modification methylase